MTLVYEELTLIFAHPVLFTIKSTEQWTNDNFFNRTTVSIKIYAISCILSKIVARIVKTKEPAQKGTESHSEMETQHKTTL